MQIRTASFCGKPFNYRPAYAEGGIIRRQRPDAMQMIRQQHTSINGKRMFQLRIPNRIA